MKCNDCSIVCDGKEVAKIKCAKDGVTINCTKEGKEMCAEFFGKNM